MVVFLHSLSTERVIVEKVVEKRAIIETDEREEIACVGLPEMPASRTRDESKVKKASNSYNEEFDPGSG